MAILDQAVAWWHADRYTSGSLTWNDLSGNGHHAQFGSVASGSDTNDPLFLEYEGEQYLYCPDFTPSIVARTPRITDMPNQTIVDLEGEFDVAADWGTDWGYFSGKDASTTNPAYACRVQAGKTLLLYWNESGTNRYAESTAPMSVSAWERVQIKITLDVDNDAGGYDVKFYTRAPGGSYAQLGSTVTGGATTDVDDDDSASELYVGADENGSQVIGKYYRVTWRNGIDGVAFADIDMTDEVALTPGATSFIEKSSNAYTVTIPRGDFVESVVVNRNLFLFEGDDYFEVPDHDDLNVSGSESFTVMAAFRRISDLPTIQILVGNKSVSNNNTNGWLLELFSGEQLVSRLGDGTYGDSDTGLVTNVGDETGAFVFIWNNTIESFTGGIGTDSPGDVSDVRWSQPAINKRIGSYTGTPGGFFMGSIIGVAIFKEALSDADIATLDAELKDDNTLVPPSNYPPVVTLYFPLTSTNWIEAQSILFSGSADDPEQGILSGSNLVWTSSLDAQIGTGSEFSLTNLSLGSHSIALIATDVGGLQDSASVDINVAFNQYPTTSIFLPNDLSNWLEEQFILFSGSATDPEDGVLSPSVLIWTSSLNDGIGTGAEFSLNDLILGSHSITLSATDVYGKVGSSSIGINVAFNQYPTGTIIFPSDGGNYTYGTEIPMEFTASGADLEDGTVTGSSLVWISDVDGNLGTGELLSVASVTEGFHVITLTTTDSLGKESSSSITINATSRDVGAPPPEETDKTVWTKEVTTEELEKTHQPGYERQDQVVEISDRGNETKFVDDDAQPISVTLEYIDGAIMAYLVNQVKLEVDAEDKRIVVPVEYASSERWKQFRKDGFLRDDEGVLQIPLMLFRKTRILKGKGMQSPINKYLDRTYQTGWNRHQTYDKFSVLNRIIPSKELISVRVPDYITVSYEFIIWTDYVEQMNGMLEKLNFEMDNYWGQRNNFKFNVKVDNYQTETDVSPEDNRVIKTEFSAEVKAYLLPETYYHTDRGIKTTSEKRYSYKKVMNIYEIDDGNRIIED